MLRGKLYADRDIVPKKITVGEPLWEQLECGCWIDAVSGKPIQVTTVTLDEFINENAHKCKPPTGEV